SEGTLALFSKFLLSTGRGDTFTINCSGFDQHGVDPAAFQAAFARRAFRPATNVSIPIRVNISFTLSAILEVDAQLQLRTSFLWLNMIWYNPFITWNAKECGGIRKLGMVTKNLWLPDIFQISSLRSYQTPPVLMAYVNSNGHIKYSKPMRVTSICNLDIFYFPFDEQNCTLTFSSFIYTVEKMVLGMEQDVQEILETTQNIVWSKGEWVLQSIHQMTKMTDQIVFYMSSGVAIRRRPTLYAINLLVHSSFLFTIKALSFYLPVESENHASFKMTLLLGYNVFLLMMNDLLPSSSTSLISVYFALCLSLMVLSLLETIFISYLLHLATTQPPPMPRWLHSLLLYCTSPRTCCPAVLQKGNTGLGCQHCPGFLFHHLHFSEPMELVGKVPHPRETELNGCPGSKLHLVRLWVRLSHMMDTLLFCLYLLFMATSVVTVIILWNT
uniref:Neurotransmitter-gated ion-channel ligand-binding domain-containing protein n=1 Tax=Capra hircus TaxID=9925 RepID=A0A452G6L1_CAPHI